MSIDSSTIKERGSEMIRKIRARFSNGVIEPLEKVNVTEGKELEVTIEEMPTKAEDESFLKAAGSWKGLIDAEEMIKNIYADRHISTRPEVTL
ncbi:MAG: antitoxin family protein [Planctomycetota bacterium]|jgi:predicted DNA-binding antitoxin AbrB/MazE fold protein